MGANSWRTVRLVICRDGVVEAPPQAREALGLDEEGELSMEDAVPELVGREEELEALRGGDDLAVEIECAERTIEGTSSKYFDIRVTLGDQPGDLAIDLIDVTRQAQLLQKRSQAYFEVLRAQEQLAQSIEELRIQGQQWEAAALRDPLTSLPNRLAVQHHLRAEPDWKGCLLFLDLDQFKSFNDSYGHPAGDARLVLLAEVLRSSLRPDDFLVRWGGEEFLALLSGKNVEAGMLIAQRLRRRVSLQLGKDSLRRGYDRRFGCTISAGLCAHAPSDTVETTVQRADEALYRAKNHGRNRVRVAGLTPSEPDHL